LYYLQFKHFSFPNHPKNNRPDNNNNNNNNNTTDSNNNNTNNNNNTHNLYQTPNIPANHTLPSILTPSSTATHSHPLYKAFIPFSHQNIPQTTIIDLLKLSWPPHLTQITGLDLLAIIPLFKSLTHLLIISSGYHFNAASWEYMGFLPQIVVSEITKIPHLNSPKHLQTGLSTMTLFEGHCIRNSSEGAKNVMQYGLPLPVSCCGGGSDEAWARNGQDSLPVYLTNKIQIYPKDKKVEKPIQSLDHNGAKIDNHSRNSTFIPDRHQLKYILQHYSDYFVSIPHSNPQTHHNAPPNGSFPPSFSPVQNNTPFDITLISKSYPYIQIGSYLVPIGPDAPTLSHTNPIFAQYLHPQYLSISDRVIPPFELTPTLLDTITTMLQDGRSPIGVMMERYENINNIYELDNPTIPKNPTQTYSNPITKHLLTFPITLSLPYYKKIPLLPFSQGGKYPSARPLVPSQLTLTLTDVNNTDNTDDTDMISDVILDEQRVFEGDVIKPYTLALSELFKTDEFGKYNDKYQCNDIERREELNRKYRVWIPELQRWDYSHLHQRLKDRPLYPPYGIKSPCFNQDEARDDIELVLRGGNIITELKNDQNNNNKKNKNINNPTIPNHNDNFKPGMMDNNSDHSEEYTDLSKIPKNKSKNQQKGQLKNDQNIRSNHLPSTNLSHNINKSSHNNDDGFIGDDF
jgi:hypothetical protein